MQIQYEGRQYRLTSLSMRRTIRFDHYSLHNVRRKLYYKASNWEVIELRPSNGKKSVVRNH